MTVTLQTKYCSMSYFILEFAEAATGEPVDCPQIEYDKELNLSVIKGTKTPALKAVQQATETFTKTQGEGTDSDRDAHHLLSVMMATQTQTRVSQEATDSDRDICQNLRTLMGTSTQTYVKQEVSDSDKDRQHLSSLVATRTLTESSEVADSDK